MLPVHNGHEYMSKSQRLLADGGWAPGSVPGICQFGSMEYMPLKLKCDCGGWIHDHEAIEGQHLEGGNSLGDSLLLHPYWMNAFLNNIFL